MQQSAWEIMMFHLYNILVYARMSVVLFIMWKKGTNPIPSEESEMDK